MMCSDSVEKLNEKEKHSKHRTTYEFSVYPACQGHEKSMTLYKRFISVKWKLGGKNAQNCLIWL